MNPINLFQQCFDEEKAISKLRLPAACCLSTIGTDGYPNARFVSLKEILGESFVITGPLNSRKGIELQNISKAAITFWWTGTEKQIRIQGDVSLIPETLADTYFAQRNRDSKIVSSAFAQGKAIESTQQLQDNFLEQKEAMGNEEIKRPIDWGGIFIKPVRIEYMVFKKSRLHERLLFTRADNTWINQIIQP